MSDIKDPKRLAGIERCLEDYFYSSLVPVMDRTEKAYRNGRVNEMRDFISSPAGVLSMGTGPVSDTVGVDRTLLQVTGEWSSKNAQDYAEECRRQFAQTPDIRDRITLLTDEWRKAVITEVGESRYGELSDKLGTDLASAYMDWRIGEMMTAKMTEKEVPQSSVEYILKKASQNSLIGISNSIGRSGLDEEIDRRAEAAYAPNVVERGAGRVLGAGMDAVLTCGTLSWTGFARFVGIDVVAGAAIDAGDKLLNREGPDIDECISRGLFGSRHNKLDDIRHLGRLMDIESDQYTMALSDALSGKDKWWFDRNAESHETKPVSMEEFHKEEDAREQANTQTAELEETKPASQPSPAPVQTNTAGWNGFLSTVGLDGIGDLTQNLGYVMAMLPDVLVGMFTGKSHSLAVKDNLMPMAAILGGLFVRNPLLKILLIGMGGANLMNKAGHEALENRKAQESAPRYKAYENEPLDRRIENPALKGGQLVMSIDKVPYSIQLPDNVIDAYNRGALPLNTLANAVLARADENNRLLAERYEAETRNEQSIRIQ